MQEPLNIKCLLVFRFKDGGFQKREGSGKLYFLYFYHIRKDNSHRQQAPWGVNPLSFESEINFKINFQA